MAAPSRSGLLAVASREVFWIWRDKTALFLVVGIPLIAFTLLAATFSNAVIRHLHVAVVDLDHSQTSMTFVQAIDSAPGVNVTSRYFDLDGAMHAIRSGEALAAVYIPQHLERDIFGARRPQTVIFYNKQFFTPGNIASSAIQSALSAAAATLPRGSVQAAYSPGPLTVEQYVLTNPALNYVQFLLRTIMPTVLHILVAIAGGYAVGSEFASRSLQQWMAAAGGNALTALVGKLAPYFGVFMIMMAVGIGVIYGVFRIPFRGDPIMMGSAACLLVIAYLSVGALFQLLVRNLALGLALTGIVCSPAFGFAGVGFPIISMGWFARTWGAFLPLRWYVQILIDQAARGVPVADSSTPFIALGGLATGFFGLAWLRLRAVARSPAVDPEPAPPAETGARISVAQAFAAEYRRVLGDRGVFGLIVMGPILYGALYPQPYVGQLLRNVPIAVVDEDESDLSRTIIQALNADEAIKVAARPATLAEARIALTRREVFAIVGIPAGAERDVLKGDGARLPAYVDSAYFLLYNRTLQGIQEAAGAVTAELLSRGARSDGSLFRAAVTRVSPVEILNQPLFNPRGGYGSYVVPAAFILILQQTLAMGSATLGGVAFEKGARQARRQRGAPAAVLGQGLAHLLLALPAFALYLIILPRLYGFSAVGSPAEMFALAVPFILAVSFLGQFVGAWFQRRETAVLLLIAFSLPLFFMVGVSWPLEAVPEGLRIFSGIFPSTAGIDGLVRLNQMGATLADVSKDWRHLWLLAAIYAGLTILSARIAWAGEESG
jgi:ABC-2 type transport system permease protein